MRMIPYYIGLNHTNSAQLCKATFDNAAPKYYGSAFAFTLSNRHFLLGSRMLRYIYSSLNVLMKPCSMRNCVSLTRRSHSWEVSTSALGGALPLGLLVYG